LQARWGSFFSPQFGQLETPVGVRKSWLRRFAVRCLECRRFGLGIVKPLLNGSKPQGNAAEIGENSKLAGV
jgi:hypothetical protein